jgi:hypothetical protein
MCEIPRVYREQVCKAAKSYQCCECARVISVGELYQYAWGVWNGEPSAFSTCAECFEVREELRDTMPSGYVYSDETACALAFGNLREALADECREMNYAMER